MKNDFGYYNRNPRGERVDDCVCRAISTATGLKYEAVDRLLDITADSYMCDKLAMCCYKFLLEDILMFKPNVGNGETVGEIAQRYKHYKVIIRIKGHCTCSLYGKVADEWDCTDKIATNYWVVE